MRLIDEHYKPINESIDAARYFWVYDINHNDFFLKHSNIWQEFVTDSYIISVGSLGCVEIPHEYYFMIGDYDGGLDFIKPSEITGRMFEVFTFDIDFTESSWELHECRVVDYRESRTFYYPLIRTTYPIAINDSKAMITAPIDIYRKLKGASFNDII